MMRRLVVGLVVFVWIVNPSGVALSHGGGLDSQGGHNNRKKGNYHFHKGPLAGQSFSSKTAATDALHRISRPETATNRDKRITATVTRAVDGDTIVIRIGGVTDRVRLIGVDTPETVHPKKPVEHFGKEASAFTKWMCEGKAVKLEYDPGNAHIKHRDKYGWLLAYVYLPDKTLLNLEIVRQGYGHAYTRFPFSKMEEFRKAEREARQAKRGLWK